MERRPPPGRRRPQRYRQERYRTDRGREDGIVIGFDEMYDLVVDVHDKVSDLVKDHDATRERQAKLEEAQAKQDARITQLERWRWTMAGAAAVVGGLLSRIIDVGLGGAS